MKSIPGPGRRRQAVDHAADKAAAGGDHGGRVQVQAQLVGGSQRRHDHLKPLQRQRARRERGLGGPASGEGLAGGAPLPGRRPATESTRP